MDISHEKQKVINSGEPIDQNCFEYKNKSYCWSQEPEKPIPESTNERPFVTVLFAAIAIACIALFFVQFRLYRKLQTKYSKLLVSRRLNKPTIVEPKLPTAPSPTHPPDSFEKRRNQSGPPDQLLFRFNSTIYRTSKSDEPIESCADWAKADHSRQVFAIADGVSQSFNSSKWAEILAMKADSTKNLEKFIDDVQQFAQEWDSDCASLLTDDDPHSFVRQKQQQGAQSTLATLRLIKRGEMQFWQFSTIGDSLLVVLDTSEGYRSIKRLTPWSQLDLFPGSPDVVASKVPHIRGHVKAFEYPASKHQELILMTDALARYIVVRATIEGEIDELFPFLNNSGISFQTWVDNTRTKGLQDDDSTLIHIFPSND